MKVIYSFWQTNDHTFCNTEMAKLSHDCVKKLGYHTCLYTDKIGYNLLKNVVNYDEIVIFDDILLSKFSRKIWSLGKILAMSLIDSPFIHIDFDVFLFKKFEDNLLGKDFFATYEEPWLTQFTQFKKNTSEIYELYSNQNDLNANNFTSFNFAIVGGQDFKKVNEVCKKIINFAILHKENIEEIKTSILWTHAVIFEQIMIPNMLSTLFDIQTWTIFPKINTTDFDIETKNYIMDNFKKYGIIHLHGDKLNKLNLLKNYLI
jgi:hypothetical protein